MTWFKSDDTFWRHPKVRKLGKDRLPAVGLWELSGTWCADNITTNVADGFVPDEQVEAWDPRHRYAKRLVDVDLWERVIVDGERGYLFHDWPDYNPTKAEIVAEREEWRQKKAAQRKGRRTSVSRGVSPEDTPGDSSEDSPVDNLADSITKRSTSTVTGGPTGESVTLSTGHAGTGPSTLERSRKPSTGADPELSPGDTPGESREIPGTRSRPRSRSSVGGHLGEGGSAAVGASEPPPPRCPEHAEQRATGPCGKCADARRAREAWETDDAARREHIARDVEAAVADPRQRCDHGTDGGRFLHPVTRKSATCALCRTESARDTA